MFACASLAGKALSVELLLLGGVPDPTIRLNASDAVAFCELSNNFSPREDCATQKVIGFSGWQSPWGTVASGVPMIDRLMMRQPDFASLGAHVQNHVRAEATRLASACPAVRAGSTEAEEMAPVSMEIIEELRGTCDATKQGKPAIRASDDPTTIHFDVKDDDGGCFATKQSDNNCYNYGNDVVTNTFAQPGRGSGVCSKTTRPCVPNTCADVRRGAESDGLVWVGETHELPTALPASGHYVSLHIWPDSNFHWLRMDANLMWSHKPGGSPVKNVDNNGDLIPDPSKADVSPWTEHCGYMLSKPSNASLY